MAHLQYIPGDPRLVDQLVYELKSKGIFDQFRKECIADVDTRPAYQNLRQRVESSVSTFLSRQVWKPDLNKNQLREKLRKHILDGNYLEQGVERIVDQVVNPKVAAVFIPQVEDLVYNYLGIPRKKTAKAEAAEKVEDLLPTDLEAVSPGSVKSNDEEKNEPENKVEDMEIDSQSKTKTTDEEENKNELLNASSDSASIDKSTIPLPSEEIKLENIPAPDNSPAPAKVELENIELPQEPNLSTDIPLPDDVPKEDQNDDFKPIALHSEDSNSSSGSSLRRNMSPITPVRTFDDENSCDAQQAFENNSVEELKTDKEPNSFRFNIEDKNATNGSSDVKEKKDEQNLSFQFANQVKIDNFNTPLYDDSSNSHNLQIDYESDANSKINQEIKMEVENSEDFKKERKDDKKSSHKSSHRSRDSSRHSSSKDGKHSSSKESSRHDKKSSKDSKEDKSKSSKDKDRSKEGDKNRDSSKHRSSHKSSSSSKDKHRSSSSSHRYSSKSSEDKKSSIKDKDKSSEKDKERKSDSKDKDRKDAKDRKDTKSSSHRSDKDRKSSSSSSKKSDDKDKKKEKKDTDDHYSSSGRGNHSRRSTDRDSNDGSSSSKGSQNQSNSKSTDNKKASKSSSSKSDNTSTSGESASPSDKEHVVDNKMMQFKPIVRVDNHLEMPIANPPRLPFVPDVTLKKPRFANNFEEAKKMMKMRKFLAEEQKRMNQEAALLLEFQANVRPSLSQVYSSIPGPELEFACVTHEPNNTEDASKNEPVVLVETEEIAAVEEASKLEEREAKLLNAAKLTLEEVVNANKYYDQKEFSKEMINEIIGVSFNEEHSENFNEMETAEVINGMNTAKIIIEENIDTHGDSYDENKPFSQQVNEISEYGKASEKAQDIESIAKSEENFIEFEVTVTAEALSESEDISETIEIKNSASTFSENELQYFAEHEKFNAELERLKFTKFLEEYIETTNVRNKMYLINCGTYEENIIKEMAPNFGDFEVVNYFKNGHPSSLKSIVKDVPLSEEISLPLDSNDHDEKCVMFSPVKSECSFDLSSDYDAKLNEIVNKKSRQEVMEIILGDIIDTSPNKMPTIDYYTEFEDSDNNLVIDEDAKSTEIDEGSDTDKYTNIKVVEEMETETLKQVETIETEKALKRKAEEEIINNKRSVLTPNKIRKISDSDQITSTTEEAEISNNNKLHYATRSKYLGRAKRVGLPRPKRCSLPNSPSSDKSVENYVQNTPTPNGKLKPTPRTKIQRYDTSDLYKPKLHYLSRRNNIR